MISRKISSLDFQRSCNFKSYYDELAKKIIQLLKPKVDATWILKSELHFARVKQISNAEQEYWPFHSLTTMRHLPSSLLLGYFDLPHWHPKSKQTMRCLFVRSYLKYEIYALTICLVSELLLKHAFTEKEVNIRINIMPFHLGHYYKLICWG